MGNNNNHQNNIINENDTNHAIYIPESISDKLYNSIVRIQKENEIGTGFFIKIFIKEKLKYFLFTCFHVISKNDIDSKISIDIYFGKKNNETKRSIKLDNKERYISYFEGGKDVTVIEVLGKDKIPDNKYLLADLSYKYGYDIYKNGKFLLAGYPRDSICENERHISSGEIKNINGFEFEHSLHTGHGSSGSPICLFNNIQVIGIHKAGHKKDPINYGTFIGAIIDELQNENQEIKSKIKTEEKTKNNINEKLIKFNQKYHMNIRDINITELKLDFIDNKELLKDLSNIINLNNVKRVILRDYYHYFELKNLAKFEKLNELYISNNMVFNINLLKQINFNELKILHLNGNNISNIKVLGSVKLRELNELNLDWNEIDDISILENVNFKELKILSFYHNKISNIKVLERVQFIKLNILDLGDNKITNINILENVNFKELKKLYLNNNIISDIKVLERVKFEKLNLLDLDCNNISKRKFSTLIQNLSNKFELRLESYDQGIYLN